MTPHRDLDEPGKAPPECLCIGACGKVFLLEGELADRWRISVKKLQQDRLSGEGIRFLKGRAFVRYRLADVLAWEEQHLQQSTTMPHAEVGGRS